MVIIIIAKKDAATTAPKIKFNKHITDEKQPKHKATAKNTSGLFIDFYLHSTNLELYMVLP